MRDFVRMSIPYLDLRNINHLEQWTIAQHHGLPTRFLDWTENPLIAAYFATENSGERDVVIYAMDKTQFNVIFEQEDTDIFSLPEEDKVVFYTPSYFHPRIIAQKGVFTIHASPTTPLDKTRINNRNCKIERIIIKNNIVPEFIHNLDWFGINRSFIYPGLDGLAYHLDSKAKEKDSMYVPIMKNRTVEMSVLTQLAGLGVFNNTENVFPLVELIQEKIRTNNNNTSIDSLIELLKDNSEMSVMVDFYKSTKLNSTTDTIRNYVTASTRQPEFCISEVNKFGEFSNRVVPVISYLSDITPPIQIETDEKKLRTTFPKIAFRVKTQDFDVLFPIIENIIKESDLLLLDIESSSHTNPVFKKIYRKISESKKDKKFISIIISAHRPEALTNKSMVNGEPIASIDNSLKDMYSSSTLNKFDGFGDYASIVASLPSSGGTISPAGVYYSNENNFFVSFTGRAPLLSEFPDYIAPNIVNSEYWSEFDDEHHSKCPGCREISSIMQKEKSGKNQAQWKMIAMSHYIYTLYETNA